MRDLIKKILREGMQISDDAPYWVKEFHTLPREGRIAQIEKNKKNIEKLLPRITEFFKTKLGDDLVHLVITTDKRGSHYGNENYSTTRVVISFYFRDITPNVRALKHQIINDFKSFFNLDIHYYGLPLDLEFNKMTWEKF